MSAKKPEESTHRVLQFQVYSMAIFWDKEHVEAPRLIRRFLGRSLGGAHSIQEQTDYLFVFAWAASILQYAHSLGVSG